MPMNHSTHEQLLQSLVLRHRDSPSPSLPVDWALLRLLDRNHSDQLSADLRTAAPNGWEVHPASESLEDVLPEKPGLYMFVWRPWLDFTLDPNGAQRLLQILYVGLAGARRCEGDPNSNTIKDRFKGYKKFLRSDPKNLWSKFEPQGRDQTLSRYLALRPLEYWFVTISDGDSLESLEDRLIKTLNPPCNVAARPLMIKMAGPEQPAFQ